MNFDYHAFIADSSNRDNTTNGASHHLVGEFKARCTLRSLLYREKHNARQDYIKGVSRAVAHRLPEALRFEPDFLVLPAPDWIGLRVAFELETPWYSKDDCLFHVLDNPIRKDRVFGVPFMSAASWKGLLRWACGMQQMNAEEITHLFGNQKHAQSRFQRGALAFYPTWFDKLGFEGINPHSRKTRAGTQPISYEVVPKGGKGRVNLLYAPLPHGDEIAPESTCERMSTLIETLEVLLFSYGISAKRTAGWGTARTVRWEAFQKGKSPLNSPRMEEFKAAFGSWLSGTP